MRKISSALFYTFFLILFFGCASHSVPLKLSEKFSLYTMTNPPVIGETLAKDAIKLGGLSGLQFIKEESDGLVFQSITDRGPVAEMIGPDRFFLLPENSPKILTMRADLKNNELSVIENLALQKKDASPITGLPNSRVEENPTDIFGLYYSVDKDGLDLEGLVSDGNRGWWMADEYGPSLVHFSSEGKIIKRLLPGAELPRMYSERKADRGFAAVALSENKVYGFLQSPLAKEAHPEIYENGLFSRIVEIDLETMKTSAEFFYPFELGNDSIGDAVSIAPKIFLVLEQNDKKDEKAQHAIYRIKLGETDNLVEKKLMVDLKNSPFGNHEQIEGLAFIDNHRLALVYDNDFGITGKPDPKSGRASIQDRKNQILVIEFSEDLLLK